MHRRLQNVFKNFKVEGTDLREQNVTEGWLQKAFKNFKVGGSDLSATTPG